MTHLVTILQYSALLRAFLKRYLYRILTPVETSFNERSYCVNTAFKIMRSDMCSISNEEC